MEHLVFSPADIPILGGLHFGGYGLTSEWASLDIFYSKHQENQQAMESLKRKNMQDNLIRSIRKMKLKRLDEFKHAFVQFFCKKLSSARHLTQHPMQKTDPDGRTEKLISASIDKADFNVPIAHIDAIHNGRNPDIYFIGKYSQMKKCEWLGTQVTIRKFVSSDSSKVEKNALVPEIQVLGQIRHPFILLLLAATYDDKQNLMLLYEHVEYGSLFVYLHEELKTPSVEFVLSILYQVAQVLIFLHESGWIHTNLTSHALQLMSFHQVKLSCFELAINKNTKNEVNPLSNTVRSHLYQWQAPEYYAGSKFDTCTDIFQFGLLAWELSQRQIPWNELSEEELKEKYLFQKQVVSLKCGKNISPLKSIMEQAINLRSKDRKLNLQKALKLLSSAKEPTNQRQDSSQSKPANKNNPHKYSHQPPRGNELSINDNNGPMGNIAQKEDTQKSLQNKGVKVKKGSLRENIPPSQKCASLEDIKASVDTYTGLRRVTKTYLRTSNVFQQRMAHVSSATSKTSADSSSSKWKDEADYLDFSDERERKRYKRIHQRDNLINVHYSSTGSSLKKLSCNFSISSSMGIKPASHSLEKQPSASNSQELFKTIGTSTPYRASAIKPASHQSQRGFSNMHSKTVTEASKTIRCANYQERMCNTVNLCKERHNYLQRMDPFVTKYATGDYHISKKIKGHSESGNKCLELLSSSILKHDNKSLYARKGTDTSIKGANIDCGSEGIKNNDCHMLTNHAAEKEPEVITKICEQLLSMIKEPYLVKKEVNGTKIFPISSEKSNIKKDLTSNKDYDTKVHFKDACSQKKTSLQIQNPSMSILSTLGLNLMDFYEDDELGPSLCNDEHMQLKICQEFGKSIDTFINVEDFSIDQPSESIWRSDEEEIETDAELNNKCKFNSLYYKLSQTQEDQGFL